MIPPEVISESREKANALISRPKSYLAAIFIVGIWLLCIAGVACLVV